MRDRLSSDLLRVVNQFGTRDSRAADNPAWGYVSVGDALAVLNSCIGTLAALRGIEMENMTRGPGWHFLSIGRRIERSVHLVKLFRTIIVPLSLQTWPALEMLLEVDGQFDGLPLAILHDFAARAGARSLDERRNESAVACLSDEGSLRALPEFVQHALRSRMADRQTKTSGRSGVAIYFARMFACFANRGRSVLASGWMNFSHELDAALPALSNAITHAYFSHAEAERTT